MESQLASLRSIKRDAYAQVEILKKLLYEPFYVRRKMKIVRKMQKSWLLCVLRDIYI
jgi:hypothetical protein